MTVPVATIVVGPHDIVEEANDTACALVGYSRAELVGLHGSELVPGERHPATAVSLDRMRLGTVTSRDGVLRHKNGTFVPVVVEAGLRAGNRLVFEIRPRTAG